MTILEQIKRYQLVAILRGAQLSAVPAIAEALYDGGIRCIEVTLNSDEPFKAIETIVSLMGDRMLVGAGTVLKPGEARDAVKAGASFIISPVFQPGVIDATKTLNAVSIPGAYTPTEIYQAYEAGADIVKVFPGTAGPGFIREIRGPLPYIPLMPTGGIGIANIRDFRDAGAVAFGIGKSLVDTAKKVDEENLAAIRMMATELIVAVRSAS